MSRMNWLAGAALACWVTASSVGYAAPPVPTTPPAAPPADRVAPPAAPNPAPAATLRAKDVLGSKISLKGGLAIGTVDDIIFDDNGDIDYLVVANEGKDVLVPWEAAKFDFSARTATLEITQEQYREVPTYAPAQLPANVYEPAFREKIYGYYGVQPRRPLRRP